MFVNESDESVSETGPVALQDGDRLRLGDYEILVSVDDRIDFLPAASELHSAEKHLDAGIGAKLDLDSLFTPRETRRLEFDFHAQCVRAQAAEGVARGRGAPRAQPESESAGRRTAARARQPAGRGRGAGHGLVHAR